MDVESWYFNRYCISTNYFIKIKDSYFNIHESSIKVITTKCNLIYFFIIFHSILHIYFNNYICSTNVSYTLVYLYIIRFILSTTTTWTKYSYFIVIYSAICIYRINCTISISTLWIICWQHSHSLTDIHIYI